MRYLLTWEMDRKLAKRLVRKQFLKYDCLKSVCGLTIFYCGILEIFMPMQQDFLSYMVFIECFLLVVMWVYIRKCHNRYPRPGFRASYKAEFYPGFFVVTGKHYQRKYLYNEIDRCMIKKGDVFFLTRYEGVIFPAGLWKSNEEQDMFIQFIKNVRGD